MGDGKNVAVWGDNSQGTWNLDVANQFLSVSKNSLIGKNIWAGVVDDFYYCRGTVRGWNFFFSRIGSRSMASKTPWRGKGRSRNSAVVRRTRGRGNNARSIGSRSGRFGFHNEYGYCLDAFLRFIDPSNCSRSMKNHFFLKNCWLQGSQSFCE